MKKTWWIVVVVAALNLTPVEGQHQFFMRV